MAYAVSLAGVAADDLEIGVRVILRQLLLRKPFPQELEAVLLACAWAEIPIDISKCSRPGLENLVRRPTFPDQADSRDDTRQSL